MLDVNDGAMKLPNRTFCALCLKFRGIVATVYHYFEGADSNYRLGCLRSIFKALAINTVQDSLTYKIVNVANIAKALYNLVLAVLQPHTYKDLQGLIVIYSIIRNEVVDFLLLYREVL